MPRATASPSEHNHPFERKMPDRLRRLSGSFMSAK